MQAQYEALLDTASNTTKQTQLISVQGLLIMATYMLVQGLREQKPARRCVLPASHLNGPTSLYLCIHTSISPRRVGP